MKGERWIDLAGVSQGEAWRGVEIGLISVCTHHRHAAGAHTAASIQHSSILHLWYNSL